MTAERIEARQVLVFFLDRARSAQLLNHVKTVEQAISILAYQTRRLQVDDESDLSTMLLFG
jgi:hypothetical protein